MSYLTENRRDSNATLTRLIDAVDAASSLDGRTFSWDKLPRPVHLATSAGAGDAEDRRRALGLIGQHLVWPLDMLLRDLNLGTVASGAALTGSPRTQAVPTLGGLSLVETLGADIVVLPTSAPFGVPSVSSPVVAAWANGEGATVGQSEPAFALAAASMCTVGATCNITRKLLKTGGDAADRIVRTELAKAIMWAADAGALAGTGASGQPLGLVNTAGVHAQAGASLGWSGIQAQLQALTAARCLDDNIAFVGAAGVRTTLAQRERAPGSGLIWDSRSIAGMPAVAHAACPAATLLAGDWSQLRIVLQPGVQLFVDASTYSTTGAVRLVALLDCAVQVLQPSAFSKATSIT